MSCLYALKSNNKGGATKTYRWRDDGLVVRESSYSAGYEFLAARAPKDGGIESLDDVVGVLDALEGESDWFVIRGVLRSGQAFVDGVNRRCRDRHDDPHWRAHPEGQRWVMFDIDDMPMPGWVSVDPDAEELESVAAYVREQFPSWLSSARCYYHWSASAGLVDAGGDSEKRPLYEPGWQSIRMHLWFVFDRPVCSSSIRKWAKSVRSERLPVDVSLYNPVQPHFVADPVYQDGSDPVVRRSGQLEGDEYAVAPDGLVSRDEWRDETQRVISFTRRASVSDPSRKKYARAALDSACENIRQAPEGQRHHTIISESASIGELLHLLDEKAAMDRLVAAGEAVLPDGRHNEVVRTVCDGFEMGRQRPRYVDGIDSEGAEKREAPDVEVGGVRFGEDRDTDAGRVESDGGSIPDNVVWEVSGWTKAQRRHFERLRRRYESHGHPHCPEWGPLSTPWAAAVACMEVRCWRNDLDVKTMRYQRVRSGESG